MARREVGVEVGVGVIVVRRDEVLFGLRRGAHGAGTWSFPRYRTEFVRVDWTGGEPVAREPALCARWAWFRWDDAPMPLFLPVESLRAMGFRP